MGQAAATANRRDTVEAWDLPITKGLQESIHAFEQLDLEIGLEPILERSVPRPADLDRPYSEKMETRLPAIAGGLSVALARAFKISILTLRIPCLNTGNARFESSISCCRRLNANSIFPFVDIARVCSSHLSIAR
jgi:hypothetical protein